MGLGWRIAAPKSAKTAKRAVTRPAKTARQLLTPTPVKKAASRAWRATNPETGIRQEVEGRAIARTRRGLFRKSSSGSRDATVTALGSQQEEFEECVDRMTRSGYTPTKVSPQLVPFLRDCPLFHVIELERQAARRELARARRDESAFGAVLFVTWAYTAQLELVAQVSKQVVGGSLDESAARFHGWTRAWHDAAQKDMERQCERQEALLSRLGTASAEAIARRVEVHRNAVVRRAR
jgi:hypothetical protein